jgi:hypothetical protein
MGPRLKHIGPVGIRTKRGRACHLNEPQTCEAEVWRRSPASQPYVAGALGLVEGAVACDDLRTVLQELRATRVAPRVPFLEKLPLPLEPIWP